jgi:hypothetical protein
MKILKRVQDTCMDFRRRLSCFCMCFWVIFYLYIPKQLSEFTRTDGTVMYLIILVIDFPCLASSVFSY